VKKIAIIGSGFGGLAEAIRLQARGYAVTVFEKRGSVGGRAHRLVKDGYTFDMGPSLVTAPSIIRRVFEVAGNPAAQAACLALARKGGTVMFFGVSPQDRFIQVNPFLINENELRILGSYNNPFATARALELLAGGAVRVKELISHRVALKDYLEVFRLFGGKETMKLMVRV